MKILSGQPNSDKESSQVPPDDVADSADHSIATFCSYSYALQF
jgi:hypothetical protein